MKRDCPYSSNGRHERSIVGNPRSAMTWYVCDLCGATEPRGQGLFYGRPTYIPKTLEERVSDLEKAQEK